LSTFVWPSFPSKNESKICLPSIPLFFLIHFL
jgi:hypothetical protein